MRMNSTYCLSEGVQVRSERFGLLFYHYDGPKLYFVRSKDIVNAGFFSGKQSVGDVIEAIRKTRGWTEKLAEQQLLKLMRLLKLKGLIYEQHVR